MLQKSDVVCKLEKCFLDILSRHSNPERAYRELNHLVFNVYSEAFNSLDEYSQWEVRHYLMAIKLTHVS